jgi:serine/threonine protein kinase/tetratricopeptide (TPR) repeat protein
MRLCSLCKRLLSDEQATCPHDASPSVETSPELLPEELRARFPEREPFAAGGTGTLYLVDDAGKKLVLKVLAAKLTLDSSERARHRRELRKQQGLVHPQLPRVIEEGELAGRVWFTREHTPGESLAVRLRRDAALPASAAYSVIVQLAAALDGLHQIGLVHGDLKPGHVLLRADPERLRVQLIDATLAAPLTADRPSRRGTVDYAAKEVVEGAPATFRSDLYALGCLSYELLTGAPPFRDTTQTTLEAQRSAEPKPLPDSVPQTVRSVIASMLAKDARRRPFSAQQVRRTFEPLLAPAKPAARSEPRSALQREAAALRLTGSTAKSLSPVTAPDATVELDVDDLDEAIKESEAQQRRHNADNADDADDAAPTIALSTQNAAAFAPQPKAAARGDETIAGPGAIDASVTVPGGLGAPAEPQPSAAAEAPRRTRTSTKFGLGPVRAADIEAIEKANLAATQLHAREEPGEKKPGPGQPTINPDLIEASHAAPRAEPAKLAGPNAAAAHGGGSAQVAGSSAAAAHGGESTQVAGSSAGAAHGGDSAQVGSGASAAHGGDSAQAGPSAAAAHGGESAQVAGAAASVVAARLAEPSAAAAHGGAGAAASGNPTLAVDAATRSAHAPVLATDSQRAQPALTPDAKPSVRPKRYSNAPQPLAQSPRLLLLSAAGLVGLIVLLRLILGPAEHTRSPSVLVHVPEARTEAEAASPSQALAELSELGLIGGDLPGVTRVTLLTAPRREAGQVPAAAPEAAIAAAPAQPEDDPESELAALDKQAQTVSAVSVRGGLARASSSRQAAYAANSGEVVDLDHKARARELYQAGKYREAATAYQRATQQDAGDAAAFAGLGGSLMATGDTRKAIAAYQRAVRLQPEVSGFQAALGRAYLKKGDRARARAAYSKALNLDPNNQAARTGMASAKAR